MCGEVPPSFRHLLIPIITIPFIHAANTNGYTSVVLNADAGLTSLSASGGGFFVNPVRANLGTGLANLFYNVTTKEISVTSGDRRDLKETMAAYSSKRRDLTDIQEVKPTESAHVWDLRPVSYRAIHTANDDNSPVYYGFIAEEVAEVDPRLCFWGPDADGLPQVEGVNYDQVVPLLLQEAKQLKAAREHDSGEIAALKNARENDSAEIAALKAAREKDSADIAALQASNAEMEKKVELLFAKFQ